VALDPLLAQLIRGFAVEAAEIVDGITRNVLALERATEIDANGIEAYSELARGLHTLKGTSGSLGLGTLASLAHKLEDLVAPTRAAKTPLSADTADYILKGLDAYLTSLRANADNRDDQAAETALTLLENPVPSSKELLEEAAPTSRREVEEDEDDLALRVDARSVTVLMREVEHLRELRLQLEDRRQHVARATDAALRLPRAESADLRNLLMILDRALRTDAEAAGAVLENLEEGLKTVFLQPLRSVLEPLHRSVRDQCRATGKEASLSIVGAELSLDRRVLEALRVAIVQLVRNAVDHGIEGPDERTRAGKHREGTIVVRAAQQGNIVTVEVADDGSGLALQRIRQVASARGLASNDDLSRMDAAQLSNFIFQPGFSTRKEVSSTSGRGVGLDIVRERIEALQGTIEIEGTERQGTRFLLSLPVEFGSSPLLVVSAGEHEVAVPMLAVESVQRVDNEHLTTVRGEMRLLHHDDLVPIHDLAALLGTRVAKKPPPGSTLLVLQNQGKRAAVYVDAIAGERDLTVFALSAELRQLPSFQGASMQADGQLVLVLKPDWVIAAPAPEIRTAARALVVDDSLTARALHRAILEAGGYVVHTASGGEQALADLEVAAYDVVVCDVSMAPMDGFQFVNALRATPDRMATPIVLVSARDDDTVREEAMASGADAFVTKRECAAGRLLAEVRGAINRRKGAA
jgi:chemotaxis protein histidine kinase CheA/CheY-like chemotaxis protein